MELGGKTIDEWLLSMPPEKFRNGVDYPAFLRLVKRYLESHVYPQVNAAAIFQAASSSPNQAVYLNDHGRDHVNMVLSRVSEMLGHASAKLSAYECFILVMAIYIHDIGNFFGRLGHEEKMVQITRDLKTTPGMGIDDIEWKAIHQTARAHGGRADGVPKDTLDDLQEELHLNDETVRQRAIAALLRFADELADKRGREARLLLTNQLLEGSEVYHAYSHSLHTVEVQPGVVTLHFDLQPGDALKKLKKGSEEVYLYDEIVKRVLKMYVEGVYCSRYMRDFYELKVVNAHVDITEYPPGELARELMKLSFSFEERGYPAGWLRHQKSAREILGSGADELKTGEEIKDLIEQQVTQA